MVQKLIVTTEEVRERARVIANKVVKWWKQATDQWETETLGLHGIPRGGLVPCSYVLQELALHYPEIKVEKRGHPENAHAFIDDLIDTGRTRDRYEKEFGKPVFALFTKPDSSVWFIFPWEINEAGEDESGHDIVVRLLEYIGENPSRGGLKETPKRVLKAWEEWCSGYGQDPKDILKAFTDGAEGCDEMVVVSDIPVWSTCEHHMAPFFGTATIAYIPDGKVVGLSKFSRLVNIFARRLQVQERLTNQIADAIDQHLNPKGVGVLIRCRHMCMESRGVKTAGSYTTTSAIRGAIKDDPRARGEFLALAGVK